jgi:hypothetical protein
MAHAPDLLQPSLLPSTALPRGAASQLDHATEVPVPVLRLLSSSRLLRPRYFARCLCLGTCHVHHDL